MAKKTKLNLHDIYNIPEQFELSGLTYKTLIGKNIDKDNAIGTTDFNQNKICVRTHFEGQEIAYDTIQVTIRHELLHAIAYILGEHEFNANEKLIDNIAHLWWQYDKQREY